MTASHRIMAGCLAVGGVFLTVQEARAQLEEVVVTAQRRTESLQEVPIAVSAFSAESLDSKGLTNVSQIADFTANVTMDFTAPISGSSSVLVSFIRGIGQSDYAMNYEPGVGLYVDGVYYARAVGGVIDLLDIERIEVLKGPQGTLFGRNTIGGAISVITADPTDEQFAEVELTLGAYNRQDIRGRINLPISDNLQTSVAFSSKNRDGYVNRIPFPGVLPADQANFRSIDQGKMNPLPSGNDLGNENNDTVRAKLLWTPNDDWRVLLAADYSRVRENAAPATLVDAELWQVTGGLAGLYNGCTAGAPIPVCGSITDGLNGTQIDPLFTERTPYDNRFLTPGRTTNYGNAISGTALDSYGTTATVDWQLTDSIGLKSISAYRRLESVFGEDADMSPLVIDHHAFELDQDQVTQELQLNGATDSIDWLAGLYYFREEGVNHDYVPLGGGLFQVYGLNFIENTSYAAFGQLTWNLTDRFSVTAGVRFTEEEKEFDGRQRDLNDLNAQLGVPPEAFPDPNGPDGTTRLFPLGVQEADFSDTAVRVGFEYRLSDSVFSYISYAEGFKGGGWDTRLTGPELVAPDFAPEEAETIEIGLKSQFFDDRLRLNAAIFDTDYSNLQLIIQRGISPLTANAGESEISGAEIDVSWLPTDALEITGSYGYIDARYTELDARANEVGIFLDNEFNNTPENQFAVAVDYRQDLSGGNQLRWHADYTWRDDHFNDAVNTPQLEQEAFGLLNAALRYESAEDWFAGAGVHNATDEEYIMSGFQQPGVGFIYQTLGRPRECFFELGMSFR